METRILKTLDQRKKKKRKVRDEITKAVLDEIVKSVSIAGVSELVISRRKLLETLRSDAGEIAAEFSVFR